MPDDTRLHPLALVRDLALALQRLAADAAARPDYAPGDRVRVAAGSAMRGAAEELSAALPHSLDPALAGLLSDAGKTLARLAHDAANRPEYRPGQRVEIAAEAALRGLVHAFKDAMPKVNSTYGLALNRLTEFLERSAEEAEERTQNYRSPGTRGGELAAGIVRAAVAELEASLPKLEEALRRMVPLAGEFAVKVGDGVGEGLGAHADEAVLTAEVLVDRAARALMHAFAAQLQEEWSRRPAARLPTWKALSGAAESIAAGLTRGVGEGTFEALGAAGKRLRRPAAAVAVVGAGVVALGLGLRAWSRA